jgi:hypothetical protein
MTPTPSATGARETPEDVLAEIEEYFRAHGQTRADAIRFADSAIAPSTWSRIPVPELRVFAERYHAAQSFWASRR